MQLWALGILRIIYFNKCKREQLSCELGEFNLRLEVESLSVG